MSSSATPRHSEERSDEAMQNIAVILDCFASLAMTRAILHLQFVSILTIIVSVPTMRRGGQRALLRPCMMNVRTPRKQGTQHAGADRRQPPHRDAGHLIRRLHQISFALFLDQAKAFDVTPVQYAALVAINSHPGIDQTTLCNFIALDRTTIGDVVGRLQRKKLITRVNGAHD